MFSSTCEVNVETGAAIASCFVFFNSFGVKKHHLLPSDPSLVKKYLSFLIFWSLVAKNAALAPPSVVFCQNMLQCCHHVGGATGSEKDPLPGFELRSSWVLCEGLESPPPNPTTACARFPKCLGAKNNLNLPLLAKVKQLAWEVITPHASYSGKVRTQHCPLIRVLHEGQVHAFAVYTGAALMSSVRDKCKRAVIR